MNNQQLPMYQGMDQNYGFDPNMQGMNNNNLMFERLNRRINRLERQIRMIENRLNRLEGGNPTFLKNNLDDSDNMYML